MVPNLSISYIGSNRRLLQFYEEEMMDKKYNDTTIKHILALIRWGANGHNKLFKDEADEIAKELGLEGHHYQANFIKAQFGEIPTFEPMEIPNAKETKSKTVELKRIFDERWELEGLKYVLNSIKDASKIGDFRTKINASRLTGGTVEKLRKAGYKVEWDSNPSIFGTPQIIIDWSGKDETQIPED